VGRRAGRALRGLDPARWRRRRTRRGRRPPLASRDQVRLVDDAARPTAAYADEDAPVDPVELAGRGLDPGGDTEGVLARVDVLAAAARPLGEGRRTRPGRQRMCELGARLDPELGEDLAEVVLDGVRADEKPRPDFGVREAVAGEAGYLRLLGSRRVTELISPSTPAARTTRKSSPASTAYSSRAVLPTQGSPYTTRTEPSAPPAH
jgi:hypothetical protein